MDSRFRRGEPSMSDSWRSFFDQHYLTIAAQLTSKEVSNQQAGDLWAMLDLKPGAQVLDAPCGFGRISRPLAILGANVLGVDQSEVLLAEAERQRGDISAHRLEYLQHDMRTPLLRTGFDVACNIFSSFGYGTEADDI